MAATMSPIDALNDFGRSPQRAAQDKQEFDDLEEDEDFMMGTTKAFIASSALASPSRRNVEQDTAENIESEDQDDRDDTPPYRGRDEDTPPYPDRDRDEIPPYPSRDETPPLPGRAEIDEEATPPYKRASPARHVPVIADANVQVANDSDEELEEDPAFMLPSSAPSQHDQRAVQENNLEREASVECVQEDYEELEEDPTFFQTGPSAGPSSIPPSSPPVFSSPQARAFEDINDEANAHHTYPSRKHITENTNGRIDVSRLDLGRHVTTVRHVEGTTFSGRSIRFKRQKGHGSVGAFTAASTYASTSSSSACTSELGKMAMSMLEKPIHVMMDNIEQEKALKDAAKREETIHNNLVEAYGGTAKKHKGKARAGAKLGETWTDRYKPKKFTELLGDERTHRQAMSWLKEWDSCVFKTTSAAALARKKQLKRARESANAANGGFNPGFNGADNEHADPLGRPKDKILLLTGPPGLGKTTLAHVIATQAGYRVSEINASDDRSAKVVNDRIRQSLESTTITSLGSLSSSKPTCLIIDEIDGAAGGDAGFIKTLVRLVMEGSRVSNASNYPNAAGKGKRKEAVPLQRPIICICNDLYVPALRPLRAIARIVRFQPPTTGMLVRRLKDICEGEQLKTDHKSLTVLVEVAEGDMRSCLNTLQIVKAQTSTLDINAIKSTALGLKDTKTSVTAVWDKLFKVPAKKRQKGIEDYTSGKYITPLVKDITTCGEYDKLAQTCFENYLHGKTPADELRACNRALEWLQFYDDLDARLRSQQEYDVMPYIPYTFVPWNPIFAAVANKTPMWPHVDYDMYMKRTAHQEVADMVAKALPMHIKSLFTGQNIVSELAPLLMRIVTPDLKPVNQQLIKSEDRLALKKLVRAMLDLGISYVQDRNEEGQIVYKLEPPLDIFVSFDGKRGVDLPAARFNLRQLIAKELEAETLRRAGGQTEAGKSSKKVGDIMQAYKSTKGGEQAPDGKTMAAALDFFGRPVAMKALVIDAETAEAGDAAPAPPQKKRRKVFYKYHEGFSNAVRTNVKITELFR